jgi:hypothetical protein
MALGVPGVVIVMALAFLGAVVVRWANASSTGRAFHQARAEVKERHSGVYRAGGEPE